MVHNVVKDTNACGRAKREARDKEWIDVNCDEMMKFLGIMLFIGLNKAHGSVKELWSQDEGRNEDIANSMRRDRFLEIFYNLHCDVESDEKARLRKLLNLQNKFLERCHLNFLGETPPDSPVAAENSTLSDSDPIPAFSYELRVLTGPELLRQIRSSTLTTSLTIQCR
eukprot:TRINITY_DN476_c0_g1_i5.p1 TRINITY_DN476_c0_g1~~TRINITY_DN476_c0_g1_i5.p1  ORF type:complete len:168 (-),score=45.39 TRINITY_DN476_c0_g1_i5:342-845(-)